MKLIIRVPATTANLGPGFDCLGLALQLWNTITVEDSTNGEAISWRECPDHPSEKLPPDAKNLVLHAMDEFFKRARLRPPRVRVTTRNCIPIGRGLGSSAAAIVGGLVAANACTGDKFTLQPLLELATEIEGHPDNVSAALLGGLTIVVREGKEIHAAKILPPRAWRAVLVIPDTGLSTKFARAVLPQRITRHDAIYNIGRAALLVRAFEKGDAEALDIATGDRLHEPYRAHLVPGMADLCQAGTRAGAHGVALSGAGPSLVAFAAQEEDGARIARAFERRMRARQISGVVRVLGLSPRGASVRRI